MARALARVLWDLLWTLSPLLVPLIGIGLIAVLRFQNPFAIGLLVAVAILVLLGLLRFWHRDTHRAVRTFVLTPAFLVFVGLLVVLLVATPLILGLVGIEEDAERYDAWSEVLVWTAFVAWALALVLRLGPFAATPARRLFVFVFGLACARYFLWLFVEGDTALAAADHVTWGVLLLGLLALAAWTERTGRPGGRELPVTTVGDFGIAAAVFSAVTFLVAGAVSLGTERPVDRADAGFEIRRAAELPQPDVASLIDDPQRLADAFSPILELTPDQRWRPAAVTGFLRSADLLDHRGRVIAVPPLTVSQLDRRCGAGLPRACHTLTIHCSLDESDEDDCEDDPPPLPGDADVAYARVVRRADLAPQAAEKTFSDSGPYARQLVAFVQYWLFYFYDDWRASTIFGDVRQGHEGDWEVVTIGFSSDRPLFMALSAHCAGTWLPWDDVRVADRGGDATHPLVAVAEGSQANYHDPSESHPPNVGRCSGLRSAEVEAATLSYRITERTGAHELVELNVRTVDERTPEMRFPGRWGRHNVTLFETAFGRRYELEPEGPGPESPALKRDWRETLDEIFCTPEWDYVGSRRDPPPC